MGGLIRKPSTIVAITIPTAAATYTANDHVGVGDAAIEVPLALLEGKSIATLKSAVLVDNDSQNDILDLLFFDEEPTIASVDQGAADVSDAELISKYQGVVTFIAADYKALANGSVAVADLSGKEIKLTSDSDVAPASKSFWVLAVTRGTPTYTANALRVRLGFDQD